jgi:hypothetical protein
VALGKFLDRQHEPREPYYVRQKRAQVSN